jgi:general secretion pathway protein G
MTLINERETKWWNARIPRKIVVRGSIALIVIAILAAMLIVPNIIKRDGSARVAKTKSDLAKLRDAIDKFRIDCDRYPTPREGFSVLQIAPKDVKGWKGPYLQDPLTPDPWGNPYVYKAPGPSGEDSYLIESYGSDGKPGGDGDAADMVDGSD